MWYNICVEGMEYGVGIAGQAGHSYYLHLPHQVLSGILKTIRTLDCPAAAQQDDKSKSNKYKKLII